MKFLSNFFKKQNEPHDNPTIYADWAKIFDEIETFEIGHNDEKILEYFETGKIKWVSGVAERFTQRVLTLINNRLKRINKCISKRISEYPDPFSIANSLMLFRKELVFLKKMANIHALDDKVKKEITEQITDFAQKTQKNMLDNSRKDLSDELTRIIMQNRIDNI